MCEKEPSFGYALFLVSFPNQYGESGNETTLFLGLTTYSTDKQLEEQGSLVPSHLTLLDHLIGCSVHYAECEWRGQPGVSGSTSRQ